MLTHFIKLLLLVLMLYSFTGLWPSWSQEGRLEEDLTLEEILKEEKILSLEEILSQIPVIVVDPMPTQDLPKEIETDTPEEEPKKPIEVAKEEPSIEIEVEEEDKIEKEVGIYAKVQGQGIPKEIGINPLAVNYLKEFLDGMEITTWLDGVEISFDHPTHGIHIIDESDKRTVGKLVRKSNHHGIGLRNGDTDFAKSREWVFYNNTDHLEYVNKVQGGKEILDHLINYTKNYGCIPKFNYGGHGPNSEQHNDGTSFFTQSNIKGHLFLNGRIRNQYIKSLPEEMQEKAFKLSGSLNEAVKGSARFEEDRSLKHLIANQKIQFCSRCLVQVHSCNISTLLAKSMAQITGCQVVVGTGRVSLTRHDADGSGDHYWFSSHITTPLNNNMFYRATPVEGKIIEENIGRSYIAY